MVTIMAIVFSKTAKKSHRSCYGLYFLSEMEKKWSFSPGLKHYLQMKFELHLGLKPIFFELVRSERSLQM